MLYFLDCHVASLLAMTKKRSAPRNDLLCRVVYHCAPVVIARPLGRGNPEFNRLQFLLSFALQNLKCRAKNVHLRIKSLPTLIFFSKFIHKIY